MRSAFGFLSGLVFGIGLFVSGMADPAKVLDLLGPWDPSLAFVLGGATLTALAGYHLVWRGRARALTASFDISTAIDRPLLVGAALFGFGWGLGGFRPGPAWTSLALGLAGILVSLPAMLIGIALGGRATSRPLLQQTGA